MKLATIAACAALALATPALAAYTMVSDVISGGGQQVSGTTYTLTGTIGQSSAIGLSTGSTYSNQGGFWNIRTGDTVAPVVTFTLPATNSTLTIPVTTLTAADVHGVTGFYIIDATTAFPATPDPWGTGWISANPGTVVALGTGPRVFNVWAKDEAGNVSAMVSASSDVISRFLTVTFGGSGGTSIISTPTGIACMTGNTGTCSALFGLNSVVGISGTPDIRSELTGWSGGITSPSNPASVTMSSDTSVTGTFATVLSQSRILYDKGYASLPSAISALAISGKTIQARDIYTSGITTENLLFNQPFTVTLAGGMNATWDVMTGFTSIKGTLKVRNGMLNVQGIKVHP